MYSIFQFDMRRVAARAQCVEIYETHIQMKLIKDNDSNWKLMFNLCEWAKHIKWVICVFTAFLIIHFHLCMYLLGCRRLHNQRWAILYIFNGKSCKSFYETFYFIINGRLSVLHTTSFNNNKHIDELCKHPFTLQVLMVL